MTGSIPSSVDYRKILVAVLGMSLALSTTALAENRGSLGGSGGGSFRSECRPPDALIGVNMRSGTALDAVVAICIPLNAERTEWAGQAYEPTQYWGGSGGGYQKIACQPGDVVRRITVNAGPSSDSLVVKHISITCEDLPTDYSYEVSPGQTGGTVNATRSFGCVGNQIGSGIYGRSGDVVDKIGLMCGPFLL